MDKKNLVWSDEKNDWLKRVRGAGFDDLVLYGRVISICENSARAGQELLLVDYLDYVWVVPFVRDKEKFVLKTLYQNRKLTRLFRRGEL